MNALFAWHSGASGCLRAVAAALLCCAHALAHPQTSALTDEAVVRQIVEGRFDELRQLEPLARSGDAVAQHWWAVLLNACAYGDCQAAQARMLWRTAAKAGHERSRQLLFFSTRPGPEMESLVREIGEPATTGERLARAQAAIAMLGQDPQEERRAFDLINELAKHDASMFSVSLAAAWSLPDEPTARALVAGGSPTEAMAAEMLRRRLMLSRMRYPEILAQALAGDETSAVALCDTVGLIEGKARLPDELLPLCIRALTHGHLSVASVLLAHHLEVGDMAAATPYADLCMAQPISCFDPLSQYLSAKLGPGSAAWREWDAILAIQAGMEPAEVPESTAIRRRGLSRRVALTEANRACMARRYDVVTRTFSASSECPWGRQLER